MKDWRTVPLSRTQRDEARRRANAHRQPFLVIGEGGQQTVRALRYYHPRLDRGKQWGPPILWAAWPEGGGA